MKYLHTLYLSIILSIVSNLSYCQISFGLEIGSTTNELIHVDPSYDYKGDLLQPQLGFYTSLVMVKPLKNHFNLEAGIKYYYHRIKFLQGSELDHIAFVTDNNRIYLSHLITPFLSCKYRISREIEIGGGINASKVIQNIPLLGESRITGGKGYPIILGIEFNSDYKLTRNISATALLSYTGINTKWHYFTGGIGIRAMIY